MFNLEFAREEMWIQIDLPSFLWPGGKPGRIPNFPGQRFEFQHFRSFCHFPQAKFRSLRGHVAMFWNPLQKTNGMLSCRD